MNFNECYVFQNTKTVKMAPAPGKFVDDNPLQAYRPVRLPIPETSTNDPFSQQHRQAPYFHAWFTLSPL
jgi:hypothetical protein